MRALVIALRSLSREWRYGELAVLLFSLSVAVGALSWASAVSNAAVSAMF